MNTATSVLPPSTPAAQAARLPGLGTWIVAVGGGLGLLLLSAALLVSLRLEKALSDLLEARAALLAHQVADSVEAGLRFGVTLADQTQAPRLMKTLAARDPELLQVLVLDERGRVLVKQAADGPVRDPEARQVARLMARQAGAASDSPMKTWVSGQQIHVLMQVRDASGLASGAVAVTYSALGPQTAFQDSLARLATWAVSIAAGVTALLSAMLWWLSRRVTGQLAELQGGPAEGVRWPLLPVPQALGTLARLEAELSRLEPLDTRGTQA
jgi:hypothetical protein